MESRSRQQFIKSEFDKDLNGIITHLVGEVGVNELIEWAASFVACRNEHFPTGGFKLLVNTYGYEPESIDIHQKWRATLVALCENRCLAIAFVNHDTQNVRQMKKMASDTHNFFEDVNEAYQWLCQRPFGQRTCRETSLSHS